MTFDEILTENIQSNYWGRITCLKYLSSIIEEYNLQRDESEDPCEVEISDHEAERIIHEFYDDHLEFDTIINKQKYHLTENDKLRIIRLYDVCRELELDNLSYTKEESDHPELTFRIFFQKETDKDYAEWRVHISSLHNDTPLAFNVIDQYRLTKIKYNDDASETQIRYLYSSKELL